MAAIVELVILLGGIAVAIQSIGYLAPPIVTSAGILPLIVSVVMALIAGVLLMAEIVRGHATVSRMNGCLRSPDFRKRAAKTASWLTLATLYALVTPILGFMWATLAFLAIALTIFAQIAWWKTTIIAVTMATLIPIAFSFLFHTVVP